MNFAMQQMDLLSGGELNPCCCSHQTKVFGNPSKKNRLFYVRGHHRTVEVVFACGFFEVGFLGSYEGDEVFSL